MGGLLLGWRLGRGGPVTVAPVPQVAVFDSALVRERADSIARAEERARIRTTLLRLAQHTAQLEQRLAADSADSSRYHELRNQVLATAPGCADSVRVLLKADSISQFRIDSLKTRTANLLQIDRDCQLAANQALGGQMLAEGKLSQVKNDAVDAIAALGTRLDEVTHQLRPQPKWAAGPVFTERLSLIGGSLSRTVGPLVLQTMITRETVRDSAGRHMKETRGYLVGQLRF